MSVSSACIQAATRILHASKTVIGMNDSTSRQNSTRAEERKLLVSNGAVESPSTVRRHCNDTGKACRAKHVLTNVIGSEER